MPIVKTTPKAFAKALKGSVRSAIPVVLSKMAFSGKKLAPDQISRDMMLRSRGFISSRLRYQKATTSRLMASYGMIQHESFTGLIEQETGHTTTDRAPTIKSRGNLRRKVSPKNRLRRSTKVVKAKDFKRRPKSDVEMLAVLRKSRYKGMFILPGARNRRQGVYRFIGSGRLQLIQALGDIPQQRKRPWMDHTNERIKRDNIGGKTWKQTMRRFMSDRCRRLGAR